MTAPKYTAIYLAFAIFLLWRITVEQPGGVLFILCCIVIAGGGFVVVINPWHRDLLEPIKIAAGLYCLAFGIGPLVAGPFGSYNSLLFADGRDALLDKSAIISLFGFVCMLAGYYAWPKSIVLSTKGRQAAISSRSIALSRPGLILLAVGFLSWLILVSKSGGLGHFLTYKGSRPEIFQNTFGAYYWASFFMYSGISLAGVRWATTKPAALVVAAMIVGALLAVFQGRDTALGAIFVAIALIHYIRSPFTAKRLFVIGGVLILAAMLLGFFREMDKGPSGQSVPEVISAFWTSIESSFTRTIANDIEKLDTLMVAVRYKENGGDLLLGKTMIDWLGPINRLFFDNAVETVGAGSFLLKVLYPNNPYITGGINPGLTAETYLNFGFFGLVVFLGVLGIILRVIYNLLLSYSASPYYLAFYAYTLWVIPKMVIDGTHLLTKWAAVQVGIVLGFFLVKVIGQRGSRRIPKVAK